MYFIILSKISKNSNSICFLPGMKAGVNSDSVTTRCGLLISPSPYLYTCPSHPDINISITNEIT